MKRLLALLSIAIAGLVVAEQPVNRPRTQLVTVGTNSTLLCAASTGADNVHFLQIENRGTTAIVFDFSATITNYGGNACGHVLNPGDLYELPADKVYNGPVAAIVTDTNSTGLVAITRGYFNE